jgi:hypothetical protein
LLFLLYTIPKCSIGEKHLRRERDSKYMFFVHLETCPLFATCLNGICPLQAPFISIK